MVILFVAVEITPVFEAAELVPLNTRLLVLQEVLNADTDAVIADPEQITGGKDELTVNIGDQLTVLALAVNDAWQPFMSVAVTDGINVPAVV